MNKSRSLSDIIGMSAMIPSYLLEKIQADPNASQMLLEEARLKQCLESNPPESRLEERMLLENHRKVMETVPVLEELLAIRDGKSQTLQTLDWIFSDTRPRVVLVDWMCLDTYGYH